MKLEEFEWRLIDFIDRLCKESGIKVKLTQDTLLFEGKLINSMRIIDLMTFVEKTLDIEVPDDKLTMKYFRTPRTIAETFCQNHNLAPQQHGNRSR